MGLEATNQRGKYQLYLILIVIFLPFTTFIISAGYPYITIIPIIYCSPKSSNDNSSIGYTKCTMEEYCANQNHFNIQFDPKSIDSLPIKYALYCDRAFYSPLLNSFFFMGAVVGVTVCANYPDKIGRLPVLKALMIINIFAQINYFFCFSIQHIIVISFCSGFATYCNSVLSLMIVETMDSNLSGIVMSARSASFGLVGIVLALYFLTINNLMLLFFLNIIISVAGYLLVQKYFVESARWLNSKNRINEAIEALRQMAIINNSQENFNTFLEVNKDLIEGSNKEITEIKESRNILEIFKLKSQQKRLFHLIYIWYFVTVCFYGVFTSLNQSSGNIFLKSIMAFSGEIIAEMSSGFLANKFGRVSMIESLSYLGGVAFILSYFVNGNYQALKSLVLFISSFGFAGAMNLLYIYTNEIFPLSIKALSFGFMFLVSRVGGICIPLFLSTNLHPVIMGALSISCGYLMGKQEETLGRKFDDDVPESIRTYSVLSKASYNKDNVELIKLSFKKNSPGLNSNHFRLSFNNPTPLALSGKY